IRRSAAPSEKAQIRARAIRCAVHPLHPRSFRRGNPADGQTARARICLQSAQIEAEVAGAVRAFTAPMRWTPGQESADIEDRRGSSGFGFGGAPIGIGGAIVLLILSLLFGKNFFALLDNGSATTQQPVTTRPVEQTPA